MVLSIVLIKSDLNLKNPIAVELLQQPDFKGDIFSFVFFVFSLRNFV